MNTDIYSYPSWQQLGNESERNGSAGLFKMTSQIRGLWSLNIGEWLAICGASDALWLAKHYLRRILLWGVIGAALSAIFVYFYPDQYISRAQVRFIPPQVSERYVAPNMAMQVDQRIFALTQLVNSRLTGAKMIESFGLYPERRVLSTIADLVPRFQQSLQLRGTTSSSAEGPNRSVPSILLSFQYSDSVASQKVLQRIVELIYEENRRYRGEQSIGTTEFLQQEVKKVLDQLTEMEGKISALPTPTQTVTTQYTFEVEELHHLDTRLSQVQRDLRATNTEVLLKRSIVSALESQIASIDKSPMAQPGSAPTTYGGDRAREMVLQLRAKAVEVRNRYVEGNSDRVVVEQALEKAEAELARVEEQEAKLSREQSHEQLKNQYYRAKAELQAAEGTKLELLAEESTLKRQMAELRLKLVVLPTNEMERLILQREYVVQKEQYSELTRKLRESQVASNMERRGQGETVELIEPPTLPDTAEQPIGLLRIAFGGVLGGLIGTFFGLLSFLNNPRVRTAQHLAFLGGIPLLAELPVGPVLLPGSSRPLLGGRALMGLSLIAILIGNGCTPGTAESYLTRGDQLAAKGEQDGAILLFKQALKRAPLNGLAHYHCALSLQETGQAGEARSQMIRAAELLPDNQEVQVKFGELSYQIYFGDPGRPTVLLREVEDQARRIVSKWPKIADGYRLQTQVLIEQRKPVEAIQILEQTLAKGIKDSSIEAQLSAVYYQQREFDKARKTVEVLLEKDNSYSPGYDLLYLQLMEQKHPDEAKRVLERKKQHIAGMSVALQLAAHADAFGDRTGATLLVEEAAQRYRSDELSEARAGDFWLHRGLFAEARKWFESGSSAHPQKRSIYAARLMDLELMKKNPVAARNILSTELSRNPNDPLLVAYQAAMQTDSGDESQRTAARAKLETILTKMPNSSFVRLHLGRAYLRAGELVKASQQLERSVTLDPNYAPGWVALAETDLLSGRAALAQDRLRALLQRAPSYTPALVLQAKASLARRRPAEAGVALRKILIENPNDLEALITLAAAEGGMQHGNEVESLLERARTLAPDDVRPTLLRAQWEAASGRPAAALARLQAARAKFPTNLELRSLTAGLAIRNGNAALAAKEYKSLAEQFANNYEFKLGYANALGLSGDKQQAGEEFKKLQKVKGDDARVWLNYGVLMAAAGDFPKAKTAYLEAVNRDKFNAYALNNLAYLMARTGDDLQTALHYAEDAKRSMPKSTEIFDTLAYVYLRMGMMRNASAVLEEMVEWAPPQEKERTARVLSMIRRGESAKVRTEMEQTAVN